jgi:hypothetical protein
MPVISEARENNAWALPPRVYWTMVRDLLDEALTFAVTLRSAPYESLDPCGRRLLLEAAGQLIESGDCVLDAIEVSVDSAAPGDSIVRLHPRMASLRHAAERARARLSVRREQIEEARIDAPVWRLADVVADTRIDLVQLLEAISECYGPTRETQRRLRTYRDEQGHYASLAGRACRQLWQAIDRAKLERNIERRLDRVEDLLARHVSSFEFGLLRQANRHKLHAMLERLRDTRASRRGDELAQRRLWNEVGHLARCIEADQAARAG